MAAKQQGKKKNQEMNSRKNQKQKRSQPKKTKKRTKAATDEVEHQVCSPRLFAGRILRQMPKVRMESKARMLMKTMLTDMYHHVATQVEATLSQNDEPVDISATDVQAALKEAMTKEMAKHVDEQPPVAAAAPSESA